MKQTAFTTIVSSTLKGAGQVMFQGNAWTGLLFLAGIFWGSYECHVPQVAWGALVGLIVSTAAGLIINEPEKDGIQGLWGFNGILVGCGFATFLGNTPLMWTAMVFCALISTWVATSLNHVMKTWGVTSYTFPFVLLTWVFLLSARMFHGLEPAGLSTPELDETFTYTLNTDFTSLLVYWLKGISQVFLVNSWITGVIFLVALAVSLPWAAVWAAAGSAIALGVAILFQADPHDIVNGLFGFSPVLTAIAVGCTFYPVNLRSGGYCICAIIATVFVQAGMDALMEPWGVPTLTGPFCIATWLFMLAQYKFPDKVKGPARK